MIMSISCKTKKEHKKFVKEKTKNDVKYKNTGKIALKRKFVHFDTF